MICHEGKDTRPLWCQTFQDSYRGGPLLSLLVRSYFQINKIKYFQHFYNYENFSKPQTLYEKFVQNFSSCILHNLPCIHATYLEGPTISYNLTSDYQWFSLNCAADYFDSLSSTVFVLYESLKIFQLYILCWNICVTIYWGILKNFQGFW